MVFKGTRKYNTLISWTLCPALLKRIFKKILLIFPLFFPSWVLSETSKIEFASNSIFPKLKTCLENAFSHEMKQQLCKHQHIYVRKHCISKWWNLKLYTFLLNRTRYETNCDLFLQTRIPKKQTKSQQWHVKVKMDLW